MSREEDVNAWITEAAELQQKKELERAEQLLDRALRIMPVHPDALLQLGILYVSTGRGRMATKRLSRVIKEHPDSSGPVQALATILRISGRLEMAIQHLKTLLETASEKSAPYYRMAIAEFYAAQGNYPELKKMIAGLSAAVVDDPFRLGLLHLEVSASAPLIELANEVSEPALKATLLGMASECRQDFGAAAGHYYNASVEENTPWFASNALAAMWLNNSELNHCKTYLKEAEASASNCSEVQITRAKLLMFLGEPDRAKTVLQNIAGGKGNFAKTRALAERLLQQMR
jgi:predicted Zn-dependent protease